MTRLPAADDDVVIARSQPASKIVIDLEGVTVVGLIPPRHTLVTTDSVLGAPLRRYGQSIGFANKPI